MPQGYGRASISFSNNARVMQTEPYTQTHTAQRAGKNKQKSRNAEMPRGMLIFTIQSARKVRGNKRLCNYEPLEIHNPGNNVSPTIPNGVVAPRFGDPRFFLYPVILPFPNILMKRDELFILF